jgi:hypothetical protein
MPGPESHHHLVSLVVDLYRDADLRAMFRRDPKAVLDRYEIPSDVRAVLWRRVREEIQSLLHREVDSMVDEMIHGTVVFMPYFGIQPEIFTVSPSNGATQVVIPFTLTGRYFDSKATLSFSKPATEPVVATDVVVKLTDKDSSATTLTAKAIFQEAGAYDVTVANPPGSQETTTTVSGMLKID